MSATLMLQTSSNHFGLVSSVVFILELNAHSSFCCFHAPITSLIHLYQIGILTWTPFMWVIGTHDPFLCILVERPPSEAPLDWATRKRIALGSARGLSYLHDHCDPKIIHRDVKAANILLDEEFEAVVGDFGLAKLMDYKDTHVTTAVRGTIGHIAPEYLSTGKSSEKTDVFGYGIMLLELITGQRAFDLARLANDDDVMLLDWVINSLPSCLLFARFFRYVLRCKSLFCDVIILLQQCYSGYIYIYSISGIVLFRDALHNAHGSGQLNPCFNLLHFFCLFTSLFPYKPCPFL